MEVGDERALARGYMALRSTGIRGQRWQEIQEKQPRGGGQGIVESIMVAGMIGTAYRTSA